MNHYGFKYQNTYIMWGKTRRGKPTYLDTLFTYSNLENLIIGTRGRVDGFKTSFKPV